ncbi:Uncharacterised protein [Mycobacterium tuberculosis]|uniref:Uncharacterized protein n=1 Tax=Mycobacterium tuberculosis TaxID=1773 RepID=A0A916P8M2_MYCTX|nr:Uncharacterised protein [Mycobacterium tuberculosis]
MPERGDVLIADIRGSGQAFVEAVQRPRGIASRPVVHHVFEAVRRVIAQPRNGCHRIVIWPSGSFPQFGCLCALNSSFLDHVPNARTHPRVQAAHRDADAFGVVDVANSHSRQHLSRVTGGVQQNEAGAGMGCQSIPQRSQIRQLVGVGVPDSISAQPAVLQPGEFSLQH